MFSHFDYVAGVHASRGCGLAEHLLGAPATVPEDSEGPAREEITVRLLWLAIGKASETMLSRDDASGNVVISRIRFTDRPERAGFRSKSLRSLRKVIFTQQNMLSYTRRSMIRKINKARSWRPVTKAIVLRSSAESLSDVAPLLARLVAALGTNAAARLLGADRAQVSRWGAGREPIGLEMGRRIVDLHDVLTRILRVHSREAAAMWLVGSEPLLGGARPIDVLVTQGAAPVIRAIDGIAAGAYA